MILPQHIQNDLIELENLRSKLANTKRGTRTAREILLRIRRITIKLRSQGYSSDPKAHVGKTFAARISRISAISKRRNHELVENVEKTKASSNPLKVSVGDQNRPKPTLGRLSARERALKRGKLIAEDDLQGSGGAYDLDKVCQVLHGASIETINHRVRDGSLLAVPGPGDTLNFPVIQFLADGSVVSGLKAVQDAFPTQNRSVFFNFLIHPDQRLGDRKPIDLLKAGEIDTVLEAARRVGEQGA